MPLQKRILYILLQQDQLGLKMRPGFIYDEPMDKVENRVKKEIRYRNAQQLISLDHYQLP